MCLCFGPGHMSLSSVADLCQLIRDVCRPADHLPLDLHTGVRGPEVKKSTCTVSNTWICIFVLGWNTAYRPFFISCLTACLMYECFWVYFLSGLMHSIATTGANGMTPSFCQQYKSSWKDTTATSDLISMVWSGQMKQAFFLQAFIFVNVFSAFVFPMCAAYWQRVLWKSEWALILPASMPSLKSIWYTTLPPIFLSEWSNEGAGSLYIYIYIFLYLFRTTPQPSSSVSAGVIPGWCSLEVRAWVWTVAWCHCCGSLTPSSQTPSAPSCMMSLWKTASYASSATELYSMLFGTFLYTSFFWISRLLLQLTVSCSWKKINKWVSVGKKACLIFQ